MARLDHREVPVSDYARTRDQMSACGVAFGRPPQKVYWGYSPNCWTPTAIAAPGGRGDDEGKGRCG